ncbi:MAG: YlxR family protein [Chloroflexi bacterium]|nr:YlxR family protein [Chloroflexota bacterium]MBT7082206.1 YlxR family protein [Chloroflexota bacterium]
MKSAHVPKRTCLGCRQVRPKAELTRIVKRSDVVEVDLTGSKPGRGAYICKSAGCLDKMLSEGRLARSFKAQVAKQDLEKLVKYASKLEN